eukprot:2380143-Prymnesium_polylepis.1
MGHRAFPGHHCRQLEETQRAERSGHPRRALEERRACGGNNFAVEEGCAVCRPFVAPWAETSSAVTPAWSAQTASRASPP